MKTIALIGNPNCGKTSIFNELTGGNQIIGNWPGVTVEKKEGRFQIGKISVNTVDLPGIYSLSAQSEDEQVSLDFILKGKADLIVNIIDADNIQRNLYLTTQLIEMKIPMMIVLNRADLAERHDIEIKLDEFEKHLRLPVIAVNSRKKSDIASLIKRIGESLAKPVITTVRVGYQDEIESLLNEIEKELICDKDQCFLNRRWAAVKLLEKDIFSLSHAGFDEKQFDKYRDRIRAIEKLSHQETDIIIADYRFGFIKGLYEHAVVKNTDRNLNSDIIDKIVLNRYLGLPIFLGVMYLVFKFAIDIGGAFISFFDIMTAATVTKSLELLSSSAGFPLWLDAIVVSGIGVGIQSVMTFIPVIAGMFLMLSLLEDSGYMARAAFVMDKFMQKIGLPGKSFVPMVVGFGCSVPAIMATRTLESGKDRLVTIFLVPLMSCGARLPVYAVFAAIFFPDYGGVIVFSLYLVGVTLAVLTGLAFKKIVFKSDISHFVMELPVYNFPRPKHILMHTWNRLKVFLFSAGKVIIIGSVILSFLNSAGKDLSFGNENNGRSLMTTIGKTASPAFKPLGLTDENWPATVAIFTGIFSKESVVGTLNSLYSQMDNTGKKTESFMKMVSSAFTSVRDYFSNDAGAVEASVFESARQRFTNGKISVYAYLLFVLIYFPCLSAFGAIVGEIGWKGAVIVSAYLTTLAWAVSVIFYQIFQGHDFIWIIISSSLLCAILLMFKIAGIVSQKKVQGYD